MTCLSLTVTCPWAYLFCEQLCQARKHERKFALSIRAEPHSFGGHAIDPRASYESLNKSAQI